MTDASALSHELASGVAVVTGAGSGIGEGIAREAARRGMHAIIADIDHDRAQRAADQIVRTGGSAEGVGLDVRDDRAFARLAADVEARHGGVRLLVNNAGIELVGLSWELSVDQWRQSMDVNVHGVFNGCHAFLPGMIERAKAGLPVAVANVASTGALRTAPGMTAYLVSKAAVLSFTECLAQEMLLAGADVDVSIVIPGMVRTRIFEDAAISEAGSSWAASYRSFMAGYIEREGLTIDEAGERILQQIERRQFWVSTHPEMMDSFARERADILRHRPQPSISPEMRKKLSLDG